MFLTFTDKKFVKNGKRNFPYLLLTHIAYLVKHYHSSIFETQNDVRKY